MNIYQDNRQCKAKCWHECQCNEQTMTSHIFANLLDSVMDQFENGIMQQLEIRLATENLNADEESTFFDPDLVLVPDMDIFPDGLIQYDHQGHAYVEGNFQ